MSNSSNAVKPMSLQSFYGTPKLRDFLRLRKSIPVPPVTLPEQKHIVWMSSLPHRLKSLVGPSQTWRVFRKQQVALEFARLRKSELMTFVYQEFSGDRTFLVVHPTVLWYYDIKRNPEERCSYEIIPLHSVCKLYFDLEFEKELNSKSNGVKMTETFILIVNYCLNKEWDISIDRSHILDLDSTTETKFSRHLIYNLPNAAFRNNYDVGNFVKTICFQLRNYILKLPSSLLSDQSINFEHICAQTKMNQSSIHELLVVDNKGKQRLFCDEGVYTKNRHFRLYCSTKRNKNSPLLISPQNQFKSSRAEDNNLGLFLDSLITYFPTNSSDFKLLEYGTLYANSNALVNDTHECHSQVNPITSTETKSPHPALDSFIHTVVAPGRVSRWFYFSSSNVLVYDITGYRYCSNIQRQHRSNGIKFVVNINNGLYYQKCYDPDCVGYRSKELKLPPHVLASYSEEEELTSSEDGSTNKTLFQPTFVSFGIQDEELTQVIDVVESSNDMFQNINVGLQEDAPSTYSSFDKVELTDDILIQVMETIEVQDLTANLTTTGFHSPSYVPCCLTTTQLHSYKDCSVEVTGDSKNLCEEVQSNIPNLSVNLNVSNEELLDVMYAIEDSTEMFLDN